MKTEKYFLSPPSLQDLAETLHSALTSNYDHAVAEVVDCPDLRKKPFHLATEGLSGEERIADIGGQPNIFPRPRLECQFAFPDVIKAMEMDNHKGTLIGAGAGPFHVHDMNSELAPNLAWEPGLKDLDDRSVGATYMGDGGVVVTKDTSMECGFMMNLFGSHGLRGPVLKITARGRKGEQRSFTKCIREALAERYGDKTVSLGGVFVIRSGRSRYHIMPGFPPEEQLPFEEPKQLNEWLTYHDFGSPITCMSVLHSADPLQTMGLRMEHTHGFSKELPNAGGHYHYDLKIGEGKSDSTEEVEYEAYFNTAKVIYRIERPNVTLARDLHSE